MIRSRLAFVSVATIVVLGACQATQPPGGPSSAPAAAAPSAVASAAPSAVALEDPEGGATSTGAPASVPSSTADPATAPTPTATPTAAPVDAAEAFRDVMTDPLFSAAIALEGSSTLGPATTTTTGTLDVHLPGSHLVRTATTGRAASTVETLNASGARYTKAFGVWFKGPADTPEDLVAACISVDGAVTDTGVETVDGMRLHHLSVTPPDTLARALLLDARGISGVAGTVDAWVRDDGTPVHVRFGATWDQVVAKRHVGGTRTLDLMFSNVGSTSAIPEPEQPWRWASSNTYGYRMAYPADWDYEKAHGRFIDSYWGFDGDVVFAERIKSRGLTTNQVTSYLVRNVAKVTGISGARISSNKPARLGSLRARVVELTGTLGKQRYWWVTYIAARGPWVYWVEYRTDSRTTADDRAMAAQFAKTHAPR